MENHTPQFIKKVDLFVDQIYNVFQQNQFIIGVQSKEVK